MNKPTCSGKGDGGKACRKAEIHLHTSNHWTAQREDLVVVAAALQWYI